MAGRGLFHPPSICTCHWLCVAVQTRPLDGNYLWSSVKVHYCWWEVIACLYRVGPGGQCKPWDHSLSSISQTFWSINQDLVCVCVCVCVSQWVRNRGRETSSFNRLIWNSTLCRIFHLHSYKRCRETSHVEKQKSAYARGQWHNDHMFNVKAQREWWSPWKCVRDMRRHEIPLVRWVHVKDFSVNQLPLTCVWAIMFYYSTFTQASVNIYELTPPSKKTLSSLLCVSSV